MWFPDPSLRGFEPMARVSPLHVVSSQIAYLPSLPCRFEPDRSQFGTKRFADAVNPSAHQPVVTPCYQRERPCDRDRVITVHSIHTLSADTKISMLNIEEVLSPTP